MIEKKPNIVFILSDDQGCWAMHCAGNDDIITPNLDRLARRGTMFSNFFCASPVCSPARATILTGKIPSQHGVMDWISKGNIGPDSIEYLKDCKGYTDYLAENGYVCGLSGKWHLGSHAVPQKSMSHWYCHQLGCANYYDPPMVRDGKEGTEKGYGTDLITDDALAFIEENAGKDKPFCLNRNYTAPHLPWTKENHPEKYRKLYENCKFESCPQGPYHPDAMAKYERRFIPEFLVGYFAAITAMDANIGRVLGRLEELGIADDTVVIFMSDNGHNCGHHGIWGKGNGTMSINMYDTSIKVPAIISYPGHIAENVVCDEMLSQYDILPTMLDCLGIPLEPDANLPGHSFAGLLRGDPDYKPNETVYIYDEYGLVRMIRTKEWKYVHRYPKGPHELCMKKRTSFRNGWIILKT